MSALEITTKIGCANNCHYCPQALLIKEYTKRSHVFLLSLENFKKCLVHVPATVDIDFSGFCEPWLNPDCTEMALFAHQRGHRISVFTTLAGFKPEDIEKLERLSFKQFRVHLPAAENQENIDINEIYLATLAKLLASRLPAKFHFHGSQLHPGLTGLADRLNASQNDLITRAGNLKHPDVGQLPRISGKIACERSLNYNILLPNGEVVICCQDYGLKHVIGNLLNEPYEKLFKGPAFLRLQAGFKNDQIDILCRYCYRFAQRRIFFIKIPFYYLHQLKKMLIAGEFRKIWKKIFLKLTKFMKVKPGTRS